MIAPLLAAALAAVAPGLGVAHVALLGVLLASLGAGTLVLRALRLPEEPFLALVTGFAGIVHVLLLADLARPGCAPWAAALCLPAVAGLRRSGGGWRVWAVALCVAAFTAVWCHDLAPRIALFHATGRLDFWMDAFVHAGTIGQFASPAAAGRGMVLMADWPRPLYHTASYMPAAVVARVASLPLVDAVALVWMPLGMMVMAAGVAALGTGLGGWAAAVLTLAGLAALPAPEQATFGNGFLGFAWALEASPGTPYSIGIGCGALAALVRAVRERRRGALLLAVALTGACALVRANTFVWLAPALPLCAVAAWPWPGRGVRLALVAAGLAGMAGLLAALSWPALAADPGGFLFSFVTFTFAGNAPNRMEAPYLAMLHGWGPWSAGSAGLVLVFVGLLGPWLPALAALTALAWRRRVLAAVDAVPWLHLGVAAIAMVLAPVARNGDVTEFRHRGGPFLVVVTAAWCVHLAQRVLAPALARLPGRARGAAVGVCAAMALAVLGWTVGPAKRPAMRWGLEVYGRRVPPGLMAVAPAVMRTGAARPRFAMADQPRDSRAIDDAAQLVALTGVPAYVSCPGFLLATGGSVGEEAARRLAALDRLAAAPSLDALRAAMRAEGITHYILTRPADAPFDRDRAHAAARSGDYAVYLADPVR